ncbi:formate transporter FocA [Corallincola platygyrae]|uniref:Formate transporter FocA n=1 Tax=Corallincola platygyrae TaxID=1193278 RepID=A0ABW4XPN8_9GAMM
MKLIDTNVDQLPRHAPEQMATTAEHYGYKKAMTSFKSSFALAMIAGVFIGLAFIFYITVTTGSQDTPWGLARLVGGLAFSIGLVLIVICGGELFTSTVLSSVARASKRISNRQLIACWSRVYLGNFIGALVLVALVVGAKLYLLDGGQWGANALLIAQHKLHHSFGQAVALGVLCNMLVCLGIWMTFSSDDVLTKAILVILPVALFVSTGFEHCVANMFMVPLAISIKATASPEFWANSGLAANAFNDLTISHFLINNLLPVTLGNIIGGALFVGMSYWGIYRRPALQTKSTLIHPIKNKKGINAMKNNTVLKVSEFMHTPAASLTPNSTLMEALTAMLKFHTSGLPVVNESNRVVGFISEHDLLKSLWVNEYEMDKQKHVGDVMRHEVATVSPDDCLLELAEYISIDKDKVYPVNSGGYMLSYKIESLEERLAKADVNRPKLFPVVQDGLLVGLISRQDIMYAFYKDFGGKDDWLHSKVSHQAA